MRPHIQYLDSASVAWEPFGDHGMTQRVLSRDAETGGTTSVVQVPAGWAGPGGGHAHPHSEEVFVLAGDLRLAGRTLGVGDYCYRPAYLVHDAEVRSTAGATCLVTLGGSYTVMDAEETGRDAGWHEAKPEGLSDRPHVPHLREQDREWKTRGEGRNKSRSAVLSRDPLTGEATLFLELPPGWRGRAGSHYHSVTESAFMLAGDVALEETPIYHEGTYLFRPPRIVHGSQERSSDGSRSILWCGGDIDFNYVGVEYAI